MSDINRLGKLDMIDFIEGVKADIDYKELSILISQIPDSSKLVESDLIAAIDVLPLIVKQYTDSFSFEFKGEEMKSYQYESLIWALGESFRQVLKNNKSYRRKPTLFSYIESVALDKRFGSGRESFVMLMGQYGGPERIPSLRDLLLDDEVCGHAVYSLRLLGAVEAEKDIKPFLESSKTWVRNQAKKYYKKIEKIKGS